MYSQHYATLPLEDSARAAYAALRAVAAHVAILDHAGRIIMVNDAWRRFAVASGLRSPAYGVGMSYFEVCDACDPETTPEARAVSLALRDIIEERRNEFRTEYPCH